MLRPALLALSVVAFATACATDSLTAPEAAPVTMLAMTADASASAVIAPGESALLTTALQHANERAVGRRVRWTSSNDDVASVTPNGLVNAHVEGEATITATSNQGTEQLLIVVREPGSEPQPADTTAPAPADSTPEQPAPADSAAPQPPGDAPPADSSVVQPLPEPTPASSGVAEMPRSYVDVRMPAVTGRSIFVPAGGNLQAAIDGAQLGDEIVLQAGATYTGAYHLVPKSGTGWITIRSNGNLPAPGTRVGPAHASQMARLVTWHVSEPIIQTDAGAHHYRLIGLELTANPGVTWTTPMVDLGNGDGEQHSLSQVPHHIVLDRMYIHGTPTLAMARCIALNSAETAIIDSHVSECHVAGGETQAIAGWNGPGPYKITNNYLEGSGVNVMFGGSDPSISGLVPSDIEIRRNLISKPLSWKGVYTAKNLLELKSARRVLVEGNVLENSWEDGQTGFAVVLWSVNQYGSCNLCGTTDVTFRHNVIRNVAGGFLIHDRAEHAPAVPLQRVTIAQNLITGVGNPGLGLNGRVFQITGEVANLTIANNTFFGTHHGIILGSTPPIRLPGFTVQNNVMNHGVFSSYGANAGAWDHYAGAGASFTGNVVVAPWNWSFPTGNVGVASIADLGFGNALAGDYTISAASPYAGAGVDMTALRSFTSGVAP